jgi:hypothetical protein
MNFQGMTVAVVPPRALGDVTLYLYMAWQFRQAGAKVIFVSCTLFPARELFDWVEVKRHEDVDLLLLAAECDLLVAYFNFFIKDPELCARALTLNNIAYVTAKKLPSSVPLEGRDAFVAGQCFKSASVAFCKDSKSGLSMRDWIDQYLRSVYGIVPVGLDGMLCPSLKKASDNRVLIFPTSPNSKKNYSMSGFLRLARNLADKGWQVVFIGTPAEEQQLKSYFSGFPVFSFPNIGELTRYMAGAKAVIANDSGGGHLGSLMGLRTFTIARRSECFVWRPGFTNANMVIAPSFRFKWFGGEYIWRPFVPVSRIVRALGQSGVQSNALSQGGAS